jgi:hypothetical protein
MKSIAVKVMLVLVALGAGVFALAGTASATHVSAVITVPEETTVGQPAEIQATLLVADGGAPVAGTSVTFYMSASFGGVEGVIEVGRGVTDENGVATLDYEPRAAGNHEVRVEYVFPGETELEVASTSISVAGGSQLHRSTAGVDIPGLNVWLIIALVATVWAILLSVAVRVIAIAYAGGDAEAIPEVAAPQGNVERQPAPGAR